ncbi:uncharacterized protein FOMMEDRAFT_140085 [Fomitiporia mediterranea MF3/22]|uniref:uncharacterized protein n=1 Tax=Fomitiporia mediterranea (strain MF3/22) TaxID=694068 RepID=UPI000440872E|nr:uncharacterized protein FOMMEDRAFT_140085 [Fomitiporia mediterranea MF3/22]EJD03998.1 hypothetical protein FOMMEDRAFT_140085 [Fomitiporia mediterranea MF3/22]
MLQHVLRIGVRRKSSAPFRVLRALNTPDTQDALNQTTIVEDQDANGNRDNYDPFEPKDGPGRFADSKRRAEIVLGASDTRAVFTPPSQANSPLSSREKAIIGNSGDDAHKHRQPSRRVRNSTMAPTLYSVFLDVDTLTAHEMDASNGEKGTESIWIPDDELRGILKTVSTRPSKRTHNSLLHPVTAQELELRLHQAMTFNPLPSLNRLIAYHDTYPALHSEASYNFLAQLAIRHTSYVKAIRLLRRMEESGIKPSESSRVLYVRSLVKIGRWEQAWTFLRQQLTSGDEKTHLPLMLELLGHCNPIEFRNRQPSPDALHQNRQNIILSAIPDHLPSTGAPPVHFILTVVRYLLRISRTETAQAATLEWISNLPKRLTLPRKRHCLRLLHLHLSFSDKTFAAHLVSRKFVNIFFERRPDLQPDSSTLFLLLRSLTQTRGKQTFRALRVVHAFCKKWGPDVIDRRVRRRVASIALREGRLNVARMWLEAEDQASLPRKITSLQREAVGEQAIKPPQRVRRQLFRKLMPGNYKEDRKWRWVRRRFWKLEQTQLSNQSQYQATIVDGEKEAVVQPSPEE